MSIIISVLIVALVLALVLGTLLAVFQKIFYVEVDPTEAKIREALPGANCGGCGYPGCDGFATACAKGEAPVTGCVAGGPATAKAVGAVMGVTADAVAKVAICACRGTKDVAVAKGFYNGVMSCTAAKLATGGTKICDWSCIGLGDCTVACKFDAITINDNGIPVVDYTKCAGCGMCSKACPQKVIQIIPAGTTGPVAQCSNRNPVKPAILKACKAGCIKCGKCEKTCTKGALKLVNGLPVIDYAICDACGECVKGCPTKVLILAPDAFKQNAEA